VYAHADRFVPLLIAACLNVHQRAQQHNTDQTSS
jgi:hypothetical protein